MDAFKINFSGTYVREEIPPRCRKPRDVTHDTSTEVEVARVEAKDAPVAFRVHDRIGGDDPAREIRTHGGRLYAPYAAHRVGASQAVAGSADFPAEVDADYHNRVYADSPESFAAQVRERYAVYIIIDGMVWSEVEEPGYQVTTFGLGGINGSTAIFASTRKDYGTMFRADEFEAARAWAHEVASERGDSADAETFSTPEGAARDKVIEVLIPEAITLVTVPPTPKHVRSLRYDYDDARRNLRDARNPDAEAEAFAEVVRLREAIIAEGFAPIEADVSAYEARKIGVAAS